MATKRRRRPLLFPSRVLYGLQAKVLASWLIIKDQQVQQTQHCDGTRQTTTGSRQKNIAKSLQNLVREGPEPPESVRDPSGTRPSEENAKKSKK